VLDSGLGMCKFFQIAKASQPHPQIIIGLCNLIEFDLENKIPKHDVYLELWLLRLSNLKFFKIPDAISTARQSHRHSIYHFLPIRLVYSPEGRGLGNLSWPLSG
jgi:hypothetical protein